VVELFWVMPHSHCFPFLFLVGVGTLTGLARKVDDFIVKQKKMGYELQHRQKGVKVSKRVGEFWLTLLTSTFD
jgi:hypothetical protein